MKDIKITDDVVIYNDLPRGWANSKCQPLWHKKVYYMWKRMWRRVYTNIYYFGSLIYSSFKYLSNYVKWIKSQPRFEEFCNTCDKISWSIDKDAKCPGNKNYYPEYMTLMTKSENTQECINRNGNFNFNPKPKQPVIGIPLYNTNKTILALSIRDVSNYGFDKGSISRCIAKIHKFHKGYKWFRVNYKHNKKYRIKMTI